MLKFESIQKRVNIDMMPETILNCALPNKRGKTIPTQSINKYAPNLIKYYNNELCR